MPLNSDLGKEFLVKGYQCFEKGLLEKGRFWFQKLGAEYEREAEAAMQAGNFEAACESLKYAVYYLPFKQSAHKKRLDVCKRIGSEEIVVYEEDILRTLRRLRSQRDPFQKIKALLYSGDHNEIHLAWAALHSGRYIETNRLIWEWAERFPKNEPRRIKTVFQWAPVILGKMGKCKLHSLEKRLKSEKQYIRDIAFRVLVRIQGVNAFTRYRDFITCWENQYAPIGHSLFRLVDVGDLFWEELAKDLSETDADTESLYHFLSDWELIETLPTDFMVMGMHQYIVPHFIQKVVNDYSSGKADAVKEMLREMFYSESIPIYNEPFTIGRREQYTLAYEGASIASKIRTKDIHESLWDLVDMEDPHYDLGFIGKGLFGMGGKLAETSFLRLLNPKYGSVRRALFCGLEWWKPSSFKRSWPTITYNLQKLPEQDRHYILTYLFTKAKRLLPYEVFLKDNRDWVRRFILSRSPYSTRSYAKRLTRCTDPELRALGEEILLQWPHKVRQDAKSSDVYTRNEGVNSLVEDLNPEDEPLLLELLASDDGYVAERALEGILEMHKEGKKDIYDNIRNAVLSEKRSKSGHNFDDTNFPLTFKMLKHFRNTEFEVSKKRLLKDVLSDELKLQDSGLWKELEYYVSQYSLEDMEEKFVPYLSVSPVVGKLLLKSGKVSPCCLKAYRALLDHPDEEIRVVGERILGSLRIRGQSTKCREFSWIEPVWTIISRSTRIRSEYTLLRWAGSSIQSQKLSWKLSTRLGPNMHDERCSNLL